MSFLFVGFFFFPRFGPFPALRNRASFSLPFFSAAACLADIGIYWLNILDFLFTLPATGSVHRRIWYDLGCVPNVANKVSWRTHLPVA